ncbi:hypothetical protein F5Y11DRAFT_139893 [Daldinia sp. FL1419]|nr:hypothetical protein F5Y11DRAFT_139893 [Daldinia sp. FL1419]
MTRQPGSAPGLRPPPDLIGETRIHRCLVKIGGSQQRLLALPESWAEILSRRSKPFLNVPPEVLQNLKECYSRQLQPTQSDEAIPSADAQDELVSQDRQFSPIAHSEPDTGDGNGTQDIPWSQSSPCRQRMSDEDSQQPFVTQIPSISYPPPTKSGLVERAALPPFPPSSQEQEEPLEVQVPTGINDKIFSLGKSPAQMCATPPSAQVVPCTYEQSEQSSILSKTKPEQRIYKEVSELYRPQKPRPVSAHSRLGVASLEHIATPLPRVPSPESAGNPLSSIIPSTVPAEIPRSPPAWQTNQLNYPSEDPDVHHESPEAPDSPQTQPPSPEYNPPTPQLRSSPPVLPISRMASPVISQPHSASQTPFIRYTITYPSYNGSINDFITACMYIQFQQRRIRTSLYDDFIRAWYEGYVPYVKECDNAEPPIKALNAIDWYNQIDDDPMFSSRIVTKQNLELTLSSYPDELSSARSLLGLSSKQSPGPTSTPDAVILAKGQMSSERFDVTAEEAMKNEGDKDITEAEVTETVSNGTSLGASSTPPEPTHKKNIPVNQSMGEIGPRPAKAKGLTRSFSEASRNKRKSSEELSFSPPKRLSFNSLARLDLQNKMTAKSEAPESTTRGSPAPSSTAERKRKYADDPQKRSKQFAKYLKKRQKWEKDSIASSAPISNTPTSAQRE